MLTGFLLAGRLEFGFNILLRYTRKILDSLTCNLQLATCNLQPATCNL